ncbi:Yip1 family protein [Sphingosinicella rhizophila]|uniref:Yip1 family protein n=1 Tax=Sphingosinicella rhizophila TaxID=3050082 RepID=A0ABU3QC56_9SPHN|nr:Yip1 family protein [Sphingosinicella sp. GR2756]MDT9600953.1 Yip1 family protein [Sphingosinicella sp. GR2756]
MATNPTGASPALVERVKNIILQPKAEWPRIDAEPATVGGIYRSYIFILAAITPVAGVIGQLLFPRSFMGITYRPSVGSVLSTAVVQYLMVLLSVYILALIIEALAPNFGGTKDRVQAFKVAAYASTAAWVAGIFNIIPALAWLGLLGGLYSLYLLYLGIPVLMKVSADKAMGYVAAAVIAAILLWIVVGAVVGQVVGSLIGGPGSGAISVQFPG